MSKPPIDETTAKFDELLRAVGQGIADWALVEEAMFDLFFVAMAAPAVGPPACAFIAADNVRAKITMIDSVIRHSKNTQPMLDDWGPLHERLDKARQGRNELAHRKAQIVTLGRAKPRAVLTVYKHDIRHVLKKGGKPHRLSMRGIGDVQRLSRQFRQLARDLNDFAKKIPPLPAKP